MSSFLQREKYWHCYPPVHQPRYVITSSSFIHFQPWRGGGERRKPILVAPCLFPLCMTCNTYIPSDYIGVSGVHSYAFFSGETLSKRGIIPRGSAEVSKFVHLPSSMRNRKI